MNEIFKKGDKAIVFLSPKSVTIFTSSWEYYCNKCSRYIKIGSLYGRSKEGNTYCLNCCKKKINDSPGK